MRQYNCLLKWDVQQIRHYWNYTKICYHSLFYNSFSDFAETAFQPLFLLVDSSARWFGKVFVLAVIALTSSVVYIFHKHVILYLLETYSSAFCFAHLVYGHYLLVMIVFHYYKAVTTPPGKPPSQIDGVPIASICKQCITPKPPRTHHCSICKSCVLKMDHHCPWVNNCVGHLNHKYFMLFCIFMCLGTIYVSFSSWQLFKDCFNPSQKWELIKSTLLFWRKDKSPKTIEKVLLSDIRHTCMGKSHSYKSHVIYLWILCAVISFALGLLTSWHMYLVSVGETSIEQLINKKERKRAKSKNTTYTNPYDLGIINNWKLLLGFDNFYSFIIRVLLPCNRPPVGDGIIWNFSQQNLGNTDSKTSCSPFVA